MCFPDNCWISFACFSEAKKAEKKHRNTSNDCYQIFLPSNKVLPNCEIQALLQVRNSEARKSCYAMGESNVAINQKKKQITYQFKKC